jgi:beta-carotene 3-hydroxylase
MPAPETVTLTVESVGVSETALELEVSLANTTRDSKQRGSQSVFFTLLFCVAIACPLAILPSLLLLRGGIVSIVLRTGYAALYTYAMEYVARYTHRYLWHGPLLWWAHGTHHKQYPAFGSVPEFNHKNAPWSNDMELNDLFPMFFACIAVVLFAYGYFGPTNLSKDCWTGVALGTTLYGLSYFVGHDIVAHERLGKGLSSFVKSRFPYAEECAKVHFAFHHGCKNPEGDPYGAPYGFWLGPEEVAACKQGHEFVPMPKALRIALLASLAFSCSASTLHMIVDDPIPVSIGPIEIHL